MSEEELHPITQFVYKVRQARMVEINKQTWLAIMSDLMDLAEKYDQGTKRAVYSKKKRKYYFT